MFVSSLGAIGLLLLQWLSFIQPWHHTTPPRDHAVCTAPQQTEASCLAKVYGQKDGSVKPAAAPKALPGGYGPTQFRTAYGITGGTAGRLAVVVAYNNPYAKADLDTYSQTYGLPIMPTCTSSTQLGCFEKMSQRGSTTALPRNSRDWAFEASLDVQVAHAVCPGCRISLIEADNAYISSLSVAVDRAVTIGAQVVSMSWGGGEFSSETTYDSHFAPEGIKFVAASGDAGYGAEWPAAAAKVIAAGGTHLEVNPTTGIRTSETAWSGSGSGCSAYEPKPAWQHDTGCARRTIADVAADADPATGAAVYATYTPYGSGWFTVGGTSLSAPIVASMIATGAPTASQSTVINQLYGSLGTSRLYDVVTGSNGTCSPAYLCTAGTGYDGPTGVGAPTGLTTF